MSQKEEQKNILTYSYTTSQGFETISNALKSSAKIQKSHWMKLSQIE